MPRTGSPGRARSRGPAGSKASPPPSAPSYARAGVDLDRDEAFVASLTEIARPTHRAEALSSIGGFAAVFKAPERYREPVFLAAADGVGTKLDLAARVGRFDTVGIDCVAMVVNDLIVQGAEPLVFLDYLAMSKLDPAQAEEALRGVAEGCKRAGCALVGGETASMPGFYPDGALELVGFGVGVAERSRVIDGSSISEGNALIGLASNGCHSNGYSLIRGILERGEAAGAIDLRAEVEELNASPASALLAPTRIYVKPILNVIRHFTVNGMVHITGGGFAGNVPRVLPRGVRARIDPSAWPRPAIFDFLARHGEIPESEMLRVFNCGIGMVLIVPREEAEDIRERLLALGERAYRIGEIERKEAEESPLLLARAPRAGG